MFSLRVFTLYARLLLDSMFSREELLVISAHSNYSISKDVDVDSRFQPEWSKGVKSVQ